MTNIIAINNQSISIKQYRGQRVVTFKDIDTCHKRPDGTAGRNFRKNRQHFIEGEDYFSIKLTNDEIRRQFGAGKNAGKTITIVTESGYLMLVKSFTDDLSWEVQRQLVKTYFRAKEQNEHKALPGKPYEYFDKTYNGEPVLTATDIEHLTGISRNNADYQAKHNLNNGRDYFLLVKNELEKFKIENPKVSRWARAVMLFTHSGFKKLCKIYGVKIEQPKCFEARVVKHEMPKLLNEKQARELFEKECVLMGDRDVILYERVAELFGEDVAKYVKEDALTSQGPTGRYRTGMYYNCRDCDIKYFTINGFFNAVTRSNCLNIRKAR